jgi:hypothetical protein
MHMPRRPPELMVVAVAGAGALLAGAFVARAQTRARARVFATHPDEALKTYLLDHLTGSDAASSVVARLRRSHAGTREGELFAELYQEFREERAVVKMLITGLGGSTTSVRRVVGQATGGVLKAAAGGRQGGLALLRTLESLAIGVQGKRLLWRALHDVTPPLALPDHRSFRELEALAVDPRRARPGRM